MSEKVIPRAIYEAHCKMGYGGMYAGKCVEGYGYILPEVEVIGIRRSSKETFFYPVQSVPLHKRTFTTPNKSKIKYCHTREAFMLDLESLNKSTRDMYTRASQNPVNWKSTNGVPNIGIDFTIAKISVLVPNSKVNSLPVFPNEIHRYEGRPVRPYKSYDPSHNPSSISTKDPAKAGGKATSIPSNKDGKSASIPPRHIPGNSSLPRTRGIGGGGATRAMGASIFIINAVLEGYNVWNATKINEDLENIKFQTELLRIAIRDVNVMLENGLIPPECQNTKSINAIINFIYQGINDTGDPKVEEIGLDILRRKGL